MVLGQPWMWGQQRHPLWACTTFSRKRSDIFKENDKQVIVSMSRPTVVGGQQTRDFSVVEVALCQLQTSEHSTTIRSKARAIVCKRFGIWYAAFPHRTWKNPAWNPGTLLLKWVDNTGLEEAICSAVNFLSHILTWFLFFGSGAKKAPKNSLLFSSTALW